MKMIGGLSVNGQLLFDRVGLNNRIGAVLATLGVND